MSAPVRAGIVVTGTEVLTGRVADRNGPWLAERLLEEGVELSATIVVGDRPADMTGALEYMAAQGCSLILTSGGLGPTADDLTAQIVADFQGREMRLDEALEGRIADIVRPMLARWPNIDQASVDAATRKQAFVPDGATVIEPAGTAPGLIVPPLEGTAGPTVLVLPGPPRELQPMWADAAGMPAFRDTVAGAADYRQEMLRLFVLPESEIAETLRMAPDHGIELDRLEITTCQRNAELEIVTRFEPSDAAVYDALVALVRERHGTVLYSEDGTTVDDQVAELLLASSSTIAVAESCTGGLLGGRLIARAGSSKYVAGGVIAYSNPAKVELAGVSQSILDTAGAVSGEAAQALAEGGRSRLGTTLGVGITGIAGPGGGTEEKPVGTVWLSVTHADGRALTRRIRMPGNRTDVRERTVMVAMHLIRRVLRGEDDTGLPTKAT